MNIELIKEKYNTFRTSWFIALVALAIGAAVTDVLLRLPTKSVWRPPLYGVVITPIALALLYWLIIRRGRATWAYYGITPRNGLRNAGIGLVLGFGAVGMALIVTHIQFGHFPKPADGVLMHVLGSGIAAPIWEELLFRGMLFGSLLALINAKWQGKERLAALLFAYLIVNVLFLLMHVGTSNLQVIYLTGFLYVFAFHKTGSLIAAIAAHATYNIMLEAVALWL